VGPDLSPAIEAIWHKSRGEIARRIATLEQAVDAMLAGDLVGELRARAVSDAHKLAGSLAMFGFATGSELAREVEQALAAACRPALAEAPRLAELVCKLRAEFDARSAGRPANDGDAATSAILAQQPRRVARTILVIDDSALMHRLVQLGLGGERVRAAASGAEGVELAAREQPDAILLDVEMPELDGPATLAVLRAQKATRDIPVLFLTGHCAAADRQLVALGAAGLIAKPFSPAGLAAEIAGLLGWAP